MKHFLIFMILLIFYNVKSSEIIETYDKNVLPNAVDFYEDYVQQNKPVILKQGMYGMDLHNLKVENLKNSGLALVTFIDLNCQNCSEQDPSSNSGEDCGHSTNLNSFLNIELSESGCKIESPLAANLKKFVVIPRPLICSNYTEAFESTRHILQFHKQESEQVILSENDIFWCLIDGAANISLGREGSATLIAMRKGDCLFIPAKTKIIKSMTGLENSLEIRLNREKLPEPSIECMKSMGNKSPLSTVSFAGDGTVGIEHSRDSERKLMEKVIKIFGWILKKSLSVEQFFTQIKTDGEVITDIKVWNNEFIARGNEMFNLLDTNKDGKFDLSDIDKLSEQQMKKLKDYLSDRLADLQDIASDQRFIIYPTKQNQKKISKDEL